mmetsp:Transcript_63280/g.150928  ORF Transcript_63280/g.150928 Transcript_63280/m.150928 type:complete len:371 (+) Transcript_63280:1463-2575(+)
MTSSCVHSPTPQYSNIFMPSSTDPTAPLNASDILPPGTIKRMLLSGDPSCEPALTSTFTVKPFASVKVVTPREDTDRSCACTGARSAGRRDSGAERHLFSISSCARGAAERKQSSHSCGLRAVIGTLLPSCSSICIDGEDTSTTPEASPASVPKKPKASLHAALSSSKDRFSDISRILRENASARVNKWPEGVDLIMASTISREVAANSSSNMGPMRPFGDALAAFAILLRTKRLVHSISSFRKPCLARVFTSLTISSQFSFHRSGSVMIVREVTVAPSCSESWMRKVAGILLKCRCDWIRSLTASTMSCLQNQGCNSLVVRGASKGVLAVQWICIPCMISFWVTVTSKSDFQDLTVGSSACSAELPDGT